MKIILLFLVALLLGCANTQPIRSASDSDVVAVGTLADANNAYEMSAAPIITQATLARILALRALQRERITKVDARRVQTCADNVIDRLNAAMFRKDLMAIAALKNDAARCHVLLEKAKG